MESKEEQYVQHRVNTNIFFFPPGFSEMLYWFCTFLLKRMLVFRFIGFPLNYFSSNLQLESQETLFTVAPVYRWWLSCKKSLGSRVAAVPVHYCHRRRRRRRLPS